MINTIVSEFEAAGWNVKPGTIINTWIVKPYPAHYKEYLLIPLLLSRSKNMYDAAEGLQEQGSRGEKEYT